MIQSMTGFGKATAEYKGKKITVEMKSLNSKSLDLNMKSAQAYKEIELDIRQIISAKLERGKVDVLITVESGSAEKSNEINKALAQAYYKDLKELSTELGEEIQDYMSLILRMPDIYSSSKEGLSDEEKAVVIDLANTASDALNTFRKREGDQLKAEFTLRIQEIKNLLAEVEPFESGRIETIKERMKKALDEIQNYDGNRFEQELIYYIEKLDVSEEKMRLRNHLDYFMHTLEEEKSGKKLGFITQEIGREINTLGSKSYQVELQKIVVSMKDNLEKIKEQVLNTL